MRSHKEIAAEALLRAGALKRGEAQRKRRMLSITSVSACFAFVILLACAMPYLARGTGLEPAAGLTTATLFSGDTAGGYVLVGTIAFVLGAVVTLLVTRLNGKDS